MSGFQSIFLSKQIRQSKFGKDEIVRHQELWIQVQTITDDCSGSFRGLLSDSSAQLTEVPLYRRKGDIEIRGNSIL